MTLSGLGDRLLEMFVRRVDAGACVPNVGETCYRSRNVCGGHVLWYTRYRGTYNCQGSCANQEVISREPIGKC